mmetsp:Transcript_33892/g.49223  ORF Transcript_33892/g.49223 Transcript_33892/m.49223 type:complete len:228 (+) Transcript_33892:1131-1814(+)
MDDAQMKVVAVHLVKSYETQILDLITTVLRVSAPQLITHIWIIASLDAVLVLPSTQADPYLGDGAFTFERDGYIITFNCKRPELDQFGALENPDLELDSEAHGTILPVVESDEASSPSPQSQKNSAVASSSTETTTVNIQISDSTCIPVKFSTITYRKICDGVQQFFGYRKDHLQCNNRRRKDESIGVFCHHHTSIKLAVPFIVTNLLPRIGRLNTDKYSQFTEKRS